MFIVDYTAVLGAAVAAFVLGFLWHGPVFGKQWMKLMGMTQHDMERAKAKGGMGKTMIMAFIAALVTSYVIAQFARLWGASSITGAVQLTFWIWLGFVVPLMLNGVLWEGRSRGLYLFNIIYYFFSLLVMSAVIVMWK